MIHPSPEGKTINKPCSKCLIKNSIFFSLQNIFIATSSIKSIEFSDGYLSDFVEFALMSMSSSGSKKTYQDFFKVSLKSEDLLN